MSNTTAVANLEQMMKLDKNVLKFDFDTKLLEAYRIKPDLKDFPPTLIVYVNEEMLFITMDNNEKIPIFVQSTNQKFRVEIIDKDELQFMN